MKQVQENNAEYLAGNTNLEYIDLTAPLVVRSMMRDATQMAEAFGWFKTWGSLVIPVAVEQESEYFDLMQEYRTMREEDIATGYSSANPDEMISISVTSPLVTIAFARAPPPVGDPIATPFSSSKEALRKTNTGGSR